METREWRLEMKNEMLLNDTSDTTRKPGVPASEHFTFEADVSFTRRRGRKRRGDARADAQGEATSTASTASTHSAPSTEQPARIPRITKLMAMAIHFNRLIEQGEIANYAELARMLGVSRARVSQIMGLVNLAPDIQMELLKLPRVAKGRDPVSERHLRPIARLLLWEDQRKMWRDVCGEGSTA